MNQGSVERYMYKLKSELGENENWNDDDETLSDAVGYAVQAHHCISCSVMNEPKYAQLADWAEISDYDINSEYNGIALPAYFGHTRKENKQRHRGGHDKIYYEKVQEELNKVLKELKGVDPCKNAKDREDVLAALKGAGERIRAGLKQRKIWLYDWSAKLYNADYRDEGATALHNPTRKREGSYSAGMEWAGKFGGGQVKRRHSIETTRKGKERKVLARAWYAKYGYPAPGGLT